MMEKLNFGSGDVLSFACNASSLYYCNRNKNVNLFTYALCALTIGLTKKVANLAHTWFKESKKQTSNDKNIVIQTIQKANESFWNIEESICKSIAIKPQKQIDLWYSFEKWNLFKDFGNSDLTKFLKMDMSQAEIDQNVNKLIDNSKKREAYIKTFGKIEVIKTMIFSFIPPVLLDVTSHLIRYSITRLFGLSYYTKKSALTYSITVMFVLVIVPHLLARFQKIEINTAPILVNPTTVD